MSWMTARATLKMTETELTRRHSVRTVTHINKCQRGVGPADLSIMSINNQDGADGLFDERSLFHREKKRHGQSDAHHWCQEVMHTFLSE